MRSHTKKPPFPLKLSTQSPILPLELENEPFSYEDNGLRPEVIKSRPRFLFQIHSGMGATVQVGSKTIAESRGGPILRIPNKSRSTVSVLSVFDTYGLDITLSFLRYLYEKKWVPEHPWLEAYLAGSLVMIRPEMYEWVRAATAHYLIALLILELKQLDEEQPKMLGELLPAEGEESVFPPELLTKMIRRSNVSRDIDTRLQAERCNTTPSLEDIERMRDERGREWPHTLLLADSTLAIVYGEGSEAMTLHRTSENEFILTVIGREVESLDLRDSEVIAFSITDYADYFKSEGCDVRTSLLSLIQRVEDKYRTITEENVLEAQAWLLQLSYEVGDLEEGESHFSFSELASEIERLLNYLREGLWRYI